MQVEHIVPKLLPELTEDEITPDKILTELSYHGVLQLETREGWLYAQVEEQERGAGSLRDDIRRFAKFITWLELNLTYFGLEDQREGMRVGQYRTTLLDKMHTCATKLYTLIIREQLNIHFLLYCFALMHGFII